MSAKEEVDEEYVHKLEEKLRKLKKGGSQLKPKDILEELNSRRYNQGLYTPSSRENHSGNNFVETPLTPSYLRLRIAPQTAAINKEELIKLPTADQLKTSCVGNICASMAAWKERSFLPLQCCNTYGLHVVEGRQQGGSRIMCATIFGEVVWMDVPKRKTKLCDLLGEKVEEGETLELVTADCASQSDSDVLAILATCWIVNDEYFMPRRYFGALFKIRTDYSFALGWKAALKNMPTFTRVTEATPLAQNRRCILVFSSDCVVNIFTIESNSEEVNEVEVVGNIFPGLDLYDLPGATIRTSCLHTKKYRWSGLGFETGTVIVTALLLSKHDIVCRAKLKFSGAISVLQLLKEYDEEDKVLILISSMIGPPTVWTIATLEKDPQAIRTTELLGCVGYDAIICSAFSKRLLGIGTYAGRLTFYHRKSVLGGNPKVYPCLSVDHTAPILALRFLSDNDLIVLSRNGVHTISLNIEECGEEEPVPQQAHDQSAKKVDEEKSSKDAEMTKRRSLRKLEPRASLR